MADQYIEKIHLLNFKGFRNWKLDQLDPEMNILIGDNDTGKISILLAIDLVLSANPGKVDNIGLDRLLRRPAVDEFLANSKRTFADLPVLEVDIYLNDIGRHEFNGEYNIEQTPAHGLCLICEPKKELPKEISELIALENPAFPYEYYSVEIRSFSGMPVTPYKRPVQHLDIDNTKISNDYASCAYVQTLFRATFQTLERTSSSMDTVAPKKTLRETSFRKLTSNLKRILASR